VYLGFCFLTDFIIRCLKNVPFYILNNSAKNEPILIIFGVLNTEDISHKKIIKSLTSPE